MFDHDEMKRLKFFEAIRFVIAFAFLMACIAAVAFGSGCTTGPDGGIYIDKTVWVYVTNRVDSATGGSEQVGGASSGVAESASSPVVKTGVSDPETVSLDFRYGGFKAKNPQEDSRCRIGKLKIGGDSLSFKWESGIPSDWKRGDTKKGPMIVACAFYFEEKSGKWVGGKFDWIDERRASRSLENLKGGYGGWNAGAWSAAKRRGFCVVSADGKKRSNFIED